MEIEVANVNDGETEIGFNGTMDDGVAKCTPTSSDNVLLSLMSRPSYERGGVILTLSTTYPPFPPIIVIIDIAAAADGGRTELTEGGREGQTGNDIRDVFARSPLVSRRQ